jgi:hypothetical protein
MAKGTGIKKLRNAKNGGEEKKEVGRWEKGGEDIGSNILGEYCIILTEKYRMVGERGKNKANKK